MLNGTYYFNNSGSKWITYSNGKKPKVILVNEETGEEITRTVQYYEAFGNWGATCFYLKGKLRSALEYVEVDGIKYRIVSRIDG